MSSLDRSLALGNPLIWVSTTETERVIDSVVRLSTKDTYLFDALDGLLIWKRNKWRRAIIDTPEGEETPVPIFPMAVNHVLKSKSIMLIRNGHRVAEDFVDVFASLNFKHRQSFYQDNADILPAQFVLLSHKLDIPPEISPYCIHAGYAYPDEIELAYIVAHIVNHCSDVGTSMELLDSTETRLIVKAGLGMSEFDFIDSAIKSIATSSRLDHKLIEQDKHDRIKQSTALELVKPKIKLQDLGGLNNAKELIELALWIRDNPEEALRYKLRPIRRILLIGVPGTGKSALCEAFASGMNLDLVKTGIAANLSKFVGESEANMRYTFSQIKALAPVMMWIDEMGRDLSGGASSHIVDGGTTSRVHGEFLQGIQELPDNVYLVAAANSIEELAPEMLRADRFDRILFVGYPAMEERKTIFKIHTQGLEGPFDFYNLALASPAFTGAEIKDLINYTSNIVSGKQHRPINTQDIIAQIPRQKNLIWLRHRNIVQHMYKRAIDEWDWASDDQKAEANLYINGTIGTNAGLGLAKAMPKY